MALDQTVKSAPIDRAPSARGLTRPQKAAVIVRLLLSEGVDISLSGLPEDVQDDLVLQMARMRSVDQATLAEVAREFVEEINGIGLTFNSGIEGALSTLGGVIGPASVDRFRRQLGPMAKGDPWDRIAALPSESLLPVLETESIEVGAIVLSKLKVSKAAELLGRLPGPRARRIAYAMSQTETIVPDLVLRIGRTLLEQMEAKPVSAFASGPVERVGAILNFSPAATRDDVLAGLDETDQGFADEVRKAIFTFANITERIDARDIPKIVREVEQAALITALTAGLAAGLGPVVEFILENMSQRMASQLREEIETLGKVKDKDGEAAMNTVVATIRALESAGEIFLIAGED